METTLPENTSESTANNGARGPIGIFGRAISPRFTKRIGSVLMTVVIVAAVAIVVAVLSVRTTGTEEVLVLARPVAAGQAFSAGDLQVVRASFSAMVDPVLASTEASVIGTPAAVPLVAGTVLVSADLGTPPPAVTGFDIVALGLKAGAFPPSLSPGDSVEIVPAATSAKAADTGGPFRGVVVAVAPATPTSVAVVSLRVHSAAARTVAALGATGKAALILLPPSSAS